MSQRRTHSSRANIPEPPRHRAKRLKRAARASDSPASDIPTSSGSVDGRSFKRQRVYSTPSTRESSSRATSVESSREDMLPPTETDDFEDEDADMVDDVLLLDDPDSDASEDIEFLDESEYVQGFDGFDKPVLSLDDFVFYDPGEGDFQPPRKDNMYPPDHAEQSKDTDSKLIGRGVARFHAADSNEEDEVDPPEVSRSGARSSPRAESNPVPLRLTVLWRFSVSLGDTDLQYGVDKSGIWIETQYAYYYLLEPAQLYRNIYGRWCRPLRASQLVVEAARADSRESFEEFKERLPDLLERYNEKHQPNLTVTSFDSPRVKQTLQHELGLSHHAGLWFSQLKYSPLIKHYVGRKFEPSRADSVEVRKQVVTRTVYEHAERFLEDWNVEVLGAAKSAPTEPTFQLPWDNKARKGSKGAKHTAVLSRPSKSNDRYRVAKVGPLSYYSGETVCVLGSREDDSKDELWLGRIKYFYQACDQDPDDEEEGTPMAHLEWYERAETILGPQAPFLHELLALNSCSNTPICHFRGPPVACHRGQLPHLDATFCRFLFTGSAFLDIDRYDAQYDGSSDCGRCNTAMPPNEYHPNDIVFLSTVDSDQPSPIAQIRRGRGKKLRLYPLKRNGGDGYYGERFLVRDDNPETREGFEFDVDIIAGRCRVRRGDPDSKTCLREPTMFFVSETSGIELCQNCSDVDAQPNHQNIILHHLRMADIYSGGGGLSLGLELGSSSCIKSTIAVDDNAAAAATFACNMPAAAAYNGDASEILAFAANARDGRPSQVNQQPVDLRIDDARIDVVAAGAPCQGHSGLNRQTDTATAVRNNLQVLTALSWVEQHQAKYFVLENVPRMLQWKLIGSRGERINGLHMVLGILIRLGYQARVMVLYAPQFATPQTRQRLFIVAAKIGIPLPAMPEPLSGFTGWRQSRHVEISQWTKPEEPSWPTLSRHNAAVATRHEATSFPSCVLHKPQTLETSIGDLNPFHWKDHQSQLSARDPIPAFPVTVDGCKPRFPDLYHDEPESEYQLCARNLIGPAGRQPDAQSQQHVTGYFSERVVRRVLNSLEPNSRSNRHYSRRDWHGQFGTLTTNFHPDAAQTGVIHPLQRRVFTVREAMRAQGFPDWFKLETDDFKSMHKIIGNAVPIPLGAAIGREIHKSWLQYEKEETEKRMRLGSLELD